MKVLAFIMRQYVPIPKLLGARVRDSHSIKTVLTNGAADRFDGADPETASMTNDPVRLPYSSVTMMAFDW